MAMLRNTNVTFMVERSYGGVNSSREPNTVFCSTEQQKGRDPVQLKSCSDWMPAPALWRTLQSC